MVAKAMTEAGVNKVNIQAVAVIILAILASYPLRAETGIDGEDYILPEISSAIQRRCALKFPFDANLAKTCNHDQSRAYWQFLGYLEIGSKIEPFGLSAKASEELTVLFWRCYYKYGTRISPDFVNTNKCNEKIYINLFSEKPKFYNNSTAD